MGVVPQRDRRPRIIVDYTFWGVNQHSVPLAPLEAMQFGNALPRLLHKLRHANPCFGPVHMFKLDISDGYYRVWLHANDVPVLGVAFPSLPPRTSLGRLPACLAHGVDKQRTLVLRPYRNCR